MDETRLRFFAMAGFGVLVMTGTWLRFYQGFTPVLPPMPDKPAAATPRDVRNADYTPGIYATYVAKDAAAYGVLTSVENLAEPFVYELSAGKKTLDKKDGPYAAGPLRLSVRVEKLDSVTSRGTYSTEHLILRIENKSTDYLAYRIETAAGGSSRACMAKGDLPHNALALSPGEVQERTECIYRDGMTLQIKSAETMAIPALSYYYVSRLYPPHIGLDARTSRGHRPPRGEACTDIPEQAIRSALEKGAATWRDLIDFYGRHRCDTYLFPPGYRAFYRKGERPLPVPPT